MENRHFAPRNLSLIEQSRSLENSASPVVVLSERRLEGYLRDSAQNPSNQNSDSGKEKPLAALVRIPADQPFGRTIKIRTSELLETVWLPMTFNLQEHSIARSRSDTEAI